jgi:putative transposase
VTDTLGLLLALRVHPANVQDRDGATAVVGRAKAKYPTLKRLFTDAGYAGACARQLQRDHGLDVEVIRRKNDRGHGPWQGGQLPLFVTAAAFEVLPKRWVVERTHAWTGRPRRMAKDYDVRLDVAEAWIWLVQATLLLRRLVARDALTVNM